MRCGDWGVLDEVGRGRGYFIIIMACDFFLGRELRWTLTDEGRFFCLFSLFSFFVPRVPNSII